MKNIIVQASTAKSSSHTKPKDILWLSLHNIHRVSHGYRGASQKLTGGSRG